MDGMLMSELIETHDDLPDNDREITHKREFARELIKSAGDKVASYPKTVDSKSLQDSIYQVAALEGLKPIRRSKGDRVYYSFKRKENETTRE
jgi:hypothetical protein